MCKGPLNKEDDDNENGDIKLIPIIEEHIQDENSTKSTEICFIDFFESNKELEYDIANICSVLNSTQVTMTN